MADLIYLRKLELKDAEVSYKWRNDEIVWRQTGSKPDRYITLEIEMNWLAEALKRKNELRYAICLIKNDQYIGNVQLTDIDKEKKKAQFHIFIGERNYWGKGIGYEATSKFIKMIFEHGDIEHIYLKVKKSNLAALKIYKSVGFNIITSDGENLLMQIDK